MTSQDTIIFKKLAALKQSKFRSKFKLSQKDQDYIAAKSLETIKDHAYQFVNTRVAPDFPKNDGKQTPMRGHPAFIAQHATATCCRKCIQIAPPLPHSLQHPLEEHAGRLKRDNSDLLYPYDTPNTSSWFFSQPKDNQ